MADQFELIPYSVIASLEKKLTWLISTRIDGVDMHEMVAGIMGSIERIKTVLSDAERNQERDPDVRDWIIMLKGGLHAADDFFDGIATECLRHKHAAATECCLRDNTTGTEELRLHGGKVCGFFSCSNGIVFRFRVAGEIDKIGKDFNEIEQRGFRLGLVQFQDYSSARRVTTFRGSDIIGREVEKGEIVRLLKKQDGDENVSVIGVVGEGGIGKTAVAQMVYDDDEVKKFFEDKRVWVHASDDFDAKKVAIKILKELTGIETNDQQSFEDLLKKLGITLSGMKYLLVLDGMWDGALGQWNQLKTYLMSGAKGSKILVTTRSDNLVRVIMGGNLYPLGGLSDEQSWSLFKMLVFGKNDHLMKPQLEETGRGIANKCGGVPLAIRTVATKLLDKYEEYGSMDVLESDIEELAEEMDDMMSSQKLSYQLLPPQLKQCFAYCSLYPKDIEIGKNELIQLWMAQGYLECLNDKQQMEDVGNEYVKALLDMSFFEDSKKDDYGNLVSLKIHDRMHSLALLIAGNDFCLDSGRRDNTLTHMCFSLESNTINSLGSVDASRLRTFILQQEKDRETARALYVILRFKRLRVLNLSHSSIKKLPDLIDSLKHLRYLDLSWCVKLASLPKSIGNLFNLQTLKLTGCETLEFSTEVVTKLINLRHLEIHRCKAFEDMMPIGLGKLSSLQSLSIFYVADGQKEKAGKLNELQNLNNLRGNLEINALDRVKDVKLEALDVNLKDKKLLESLDLNWGNQDKKGDSLQLLENLRPNQHLKGLHVRWYPGETFSDWLSSIEHLSHIHLFGFHNCKYLPPLERLPCLKSLEIVSMKSLEYICFKEETSTLATLIFQSLERLKFSGCEKLRGWMREGGHFSRDHHSLPPFHCLSELIIKRCPKLTFLPTFPNVEKLQLCESTVIPLRKTLLDASSSYSTGPLSKLKSLMIEGKLYRISGLPSRWKQNLTSLETLEIGYVEELQNWFEDAGFPCLQKIVVYACSLNALPDNMCHSKTLQHIKILGCHELASLPEGMRELDKLITLEIRHCPILVERCQSETGADWPKISHVRNRILK